jgi:hypothetical protein
MRREGRLLKQGSDAQHTMGHWVSLNFVHGAQLSIVHVGLSQLKMILPGNLSIYQ